MANEENLKPWQKGQSGNPSGRPKGSRNRATIVREALEAQAINGDGQIVDQITVALVHKALEGDVRAYAQLMDSAYGKVTEKVEGNVSYTQMGHVYLQGDDGSVEKMEFNIGKEI